MIYLMRHGETVWNVAGRYQGQKNSNLTQRGREQAAQVGRLLAAEWASSPRGPLRTSVSPLGRAQETAAIVGQHVTLEISEDPLLTEISCGSWDGLSQYEISVEFPGALKGTDAFDWFFRAPDGETFEAAWKRAASWLAQVDGPILAVSHALTGRLLRGVYLGLSKAETLRLPIPQDGFFRLHEGRAEFVAQPVAA